MQYINTAGLSACLTVWCRSTVVSSCKSLIEHLFNVLTTATRWQAALRTASRLVSSQVVVIIIIIIIMPVDDWRVWLQYCQWWLTLTLVTVCKQYIAPSVCISRYPLSGYPDLSVNFMTAKNPDILKWKSGCYRCLQKWCKLCLLYYGGIPNYSKINSHASEEWMVTLVSQNRSNECLLTYFLFRWITYVTLSRPIVGCFHFTACQYRCTYLFIQTSNCTIKSTSLYELTRNSARSNSPGNL